MELVSTMEINGEEREIADAYARGQIATNAQNIAKNAEGIAGLNNNLSQLEYSDVAGGKNIINIPEHEYFNGITDTKNLFTATLHIDGKLVGSKNIDFIGRNNIEFSISNIGIQIIRLYHSGTLADITLIEQPVYFDKTGNYTISFDVNGYNPSTINGLSINKIQIEEGTTATDYEPYIPSVKMLSDEVNNQNDSLGALGKYKNLLNPTLGTTTLNGVTCTANGDGTYTLNGTAKGQPVFTIPVEKTLKKGTKILGCINGSSTTYFITYRTGSNWSGKHDYGNGYVLQDDTIIDDIDITVRDGQTLSNIIFKPMITTNLNATYDDFVPYTGDGETLTADVAVLKNDLSKQCKKDDITTNETLIGTFNGKNYYRKLFTGISGSGGSVTVNVGGKIEIYNYYGRAYTYGQSGASDVKYPIPNKNYYIESQSISETSFQLTIPTSSDTRKVDLVIEYTKVDE